MNPTVKKWIKIGGIVLGVAGLTVGGILAGRKIKRNIELKKLREAEANANNQEPPNQQQQLPAGTGIIEGVKYTKQSLIINNKTYTFDKSGIRKIQQYMSKNAAFKAEIERTGGSDGIIGETFVKILIQVLKAAAKAASPFGADYLKYAEAAITNLAKQSGLTSSEIKIS